MSQMLDDQFDDQLQDAVRDYNSPPETPREEMWARIEAVRKEGGNEGTAFPRSRVPAFRLLRWPAAIAALLALGIGLGRLSAPRPEAGAPPATAAVSPRTDDMAYRLVTTEHLGQSEAFLTLFRASVRRGGSEQIASATARQLLATNRLLLDSPAAKDDKIRLLLQDLELVLAQIAQLSPRPSSPDLDLITEGLEDGGVMSRLRTAVPSGTSTTQGVL
jgi:hypothetical protein